MTRGEFVTEEDVFATLDTLVREVNADFTGELTPSARLKDDVGLDSLSTVELVTAAERAFGVEVPYEDLDDFRTVEDLTRYVLKLKAAAPQPG
jgi:acyl carrier protein